MVEGVSALKKPGFAALFVAGCSVAAYRMAQAPVSDPDLFWHLKTGELIWTGGIPRADPFSWTLPGADWVAHEWLWQAALYPAFRRLGWSVVPVCAGLSVAIISALLLAAARKRG